MISPEVSTIITSIVYILASAAGVAGMLVRSEIFRKIGCWLAFLAFLCQTIFLAFGFHKFFPTGLSIGAYLQLFAWFILFCSIIIWFWLKQQSFLLFATQFCLLLFILSIPFLKHVISIPQELEASFYFFHIASLFLYTGFITLAFIAGIIFLYISNRIKIKKKLGGIWNELPALAILDKVNFYCALCAFPVYSIGLIAGIIWYFQVYQEIKFIDIKILISLFNWILLAILFHNRLIGVWGGRKPALFIIFIFILSIFSIIVINIFFHTMHNFLYK